MKALCLLLDRMSKSAQQIRFCTSHDGTRIAYATCGQGPPLVWAPHWIHHLRFDWDSPIWCPWLTLLTRHHSLIYYDWRGCGLSDREGVEFTPDRYVEDFEAIIEATNVDRFALVAMGQGTRMAMTYAVRHPERIRRFSAAWTLFLRARSARSKPGAGRRGRDQAQGGRAWLAR